MGERKAKYHRQPEVVGTCLYRPFTELREPQPAQLGHDPEEPLKPESGTLERKKSESQEEEGGLVDRKPRPT
jgi:hypothetical protein